MDGATVLKVVFEAYEAGAAEEVAVNGHQVVYKVTSSLTVTVAVETKAGETVSEQTWETHEVMVTKVVSWLVAVLVVMLAAEATEAAAATMATVENCIFSLKV